MSLVCILWVQDIDIWNEKFIRILQHTSLLEHRSKEKKYGEKWNILTSFLLRSVYWISFYQKPKTTRSGVCGKDGKATKGNEGTVTVLRIMSCPIIDYWEIYSSRRWPSAPSSNHSLTGHFSLTKIKTHLPMFCEISKPTASRIKSKITECLLLHFLNWKSN